MTGNFAKSLLSGSTNGKQIKVTGTNTAGHITVHTAVSGTSAADEIWLYACNTSASAVLLTLEWGGTTAPDNNMVATYPNSGRVLIVDGALLQNGLVVYAFAATANVVVLDGFVNNIT